MGTKLFKALVVVVFLSMLVGVAPAWANPPAPDDQIVRPRVMPDLLDRAPVARPQVKPLDQPNPKEVWRIRERERLLKQGLVAEANALSMQGRDRVLVILVEFAGTDVFTWNPGDTWDPFGRADPNEAVYDEEGNVVIGDCSNIITQTQTFTYTGPLHNQIPRPLSAEDRSGDTIWTEDFSPEWFNAFMFGNGVVFHYTRQDGSLVHEDFTGESVRLYYQDMSGGTYDIIGDVIGWVQVPHSTWWYGADQCPGARSGGGRAYGAIPNAGNARSLVKDALDAVNAISDTIPGFDWHNYDLDGDGIIDRLWIVHSGYGEEDSTTLLNRTDYSEASIWSHSSALTPPYEVAPGIAAGPYIIMPENGGIGVFAHEYAHNLGADDLYAYDLGETSAGFWTLMADDWTGYPIGFEPPALDPWHQDNWGWLNPFVITDTTQEYVVTLGQASNFPGGEGVYRAVKIQLPDGVVPLPVQPLGEFQWWGGNVNLANAMMTTKNPIAIPGAATNSVNSANVTLEFNLAYGIEDLWDFLWVQVSSDGGETWDTLANENTTCEHDPSWIGGLYGFPDDMCAAGIGGFTGYNDEFPEYGTQVFDLSAYAGKEILLRFWYMTDWASLYEGPFVDNVAVKAGDTVLFFDDAEAGDANWDYQEPWERNDGTQKFTHNFYLQWRNVSATGGYDSALGEPRWRFGPANTGLLVWYNNNYYIDNEVFHHLFDYPGFGPKGRMLVIDSHGAPYRDPYLVAIGYNNEGGNVPHRSLMRDAPFSLWKPVDFTMKPPYVYEETQFLGRLAIGEFHDSVGYYPGAQYVSRGPAYPPATAYRWVTAEWDSSAVVPAKEFYGIRAPGYKANEQFRWACTPYLEGPYAGYLGCYWLGANAGLGYNGGTGNPGDIGAQYGWHVQILSQTDSTATVKIWNAMRDVNAVVRPDRPSVRTNGTITYRFWLNQNLGSALSLFACAPLDTAKVEYVAGSATDGAFPLSSSCPAAAAALAEGKVTIDQLAPIAEEPVLAIGWFKNVGTWQNARFTFQVKVKATSGSIDQAVRLFDLTPDSTWSKTIPAMWTVPVVR